MADLKKIRVQVIDPATGSVVENVDVKTSDNAIYLPDGTTLRNWINNTDINYATLSKSVSDHLAINHVDSDKVDSLLTSLTFNETTGAFTITNHKGTTTQIDTKLEKIPVKYAIVNGNGVSGFTASNTLLEITLEDNSKLYADVSSLLNIYEGSNGSEITVGVSDTGVISATLVNGSITNDKIANTTISRAKIDATFEANIAALESAVGAGGSVATQINNAISALDATVTNSSDGSNVTVSVTETDGKLTAVSASVNPNTFDTFGAAALVQGNTAETVASVDAKVSSLTTSSEVTVEKLSTPTSGFISSYVVKQNGAQVGATINIPKDYLVKSAELKVATDAIMDNGNTIVAAGHKYVDFVVNTVDTDGEETHIYLDATELVDVYGVAAGATEVQLALDPASNTFSATLVNGGVSTAKLANSAVTTAKIADASVTNVKIANATISRAKIDATFEANIAAIEASTTDKVTVDGSPDNLNLLSSTDTSFINVTGPTEDIVRLAISSTSVSPLVVSASTTGASATLSYQWYKKTIGVDVAFVVIDGATSATLASNKINVGNASTTLYYCVVSGSGTGVVCDPVASKKVTVIVA